MLDVTDTDQIREAAQTVADAVGADGVYGLVNNAGIATTGPLEFIDIAELRRQLDVNVIGQVAVTQSFMPLLRITRGRIVHMGSVSGRFAIPFLGPYAASKFALEAIADAMRRELRPWGIHVCLLEPGVIATPIWDKSKSQTQRRFRNLSSEARRLYGPFIGALGKKVDEMAARGIPPETVSATVLHALTARKPRARYVVGANAKREMRLLPFVPDWLLDRLIARQIGLPSKAEL